MAHKRRETFRAWLAFASILSVVYLIFGAWSRIDSRTRLLPRSTAIADVRTWNEGYWSYFWRSTPDIVSMRWYDVDMVWRAIHVDLKSRVETPMGLTIPMTKSVAPEYGSWRLSPDGEWLLWRNNRGRGVEYRASTLDGMHRYRWPETAGPRASMEGTDIFWLPDGRRWVEVVHLGTGLQTIIHSLDGPDAPGAHIPRDTALALGVTPELRMLTADSQRGGVRLQEFGLLPPDQGFRSYGVTFPVDSDVVEVEPSPSFDRIAYLTIDRRVGVMDEALRWKAGRRIRRPMAHRFAVWVSRRDGRDLQRIGDQNGAYITSLQWTPDGRRLSFELARTLYTIPVD